MKKILCILIFICFVFLCSCGNNDANQNTDSPETLNTETYIAETSENEPQKEVILGYYGEESLNPYMTQSRTNINISTLVYDSLFRLDSSYNAVPVIADSFEKSGKTLRVKLRDDILFSNKTSLDASDVVYSFELAKQSDFYSERLSGFESAVSENSEVVFQLSRDDIFCINCLDFPIILEGSNNNKPPVGSGRYIIKKDGDGYRLKKNENYTLNEEMELDEIGLLDINEVENEYYLIQIGDLTFAFDDLSDGADEYKINANTVSVSLNNLVYLSFNSQSEALKDENVKNAVINLIDRTALSSLAYSADAKPCATVFNPAWTEVQNAGFSVPETDSAASEELLEKSGYIYAYSDNDVRSKDFEFLNLRFIVSGSDSRKVAIAKEIRNTLKKAGIGVELSVLNFDEFKERLFKNDFDLYLGEIKLTNNMDLSPFFSEDGSARFGIDFNCAVKNAYYDFSCGKIDITTFCEVFDEYMPFIPICYRSGIAYYSRELRYEGSISENNIFSNIYSWSVSE